MSTIPAKETASGEEAIPGVASSLSDAVNSDMSNSSLSGSVGPSDDSRQRGERSGSDRDSGFYSEDESQDSDLLTATSGSQSGQSPRQTRHRLEHHIPAGGGGRRGSHGPRSSSSPSSYGTAQAQNRSRLGLPVFPVSYFHRSNVASFSLYNELRCCAAYIYHVYCVLEHGRLPWLTDFGALHKMRLPRKGKDMVSHLNLNIPYYSSNYIELFYVVTMPFLLVYNTPFFLVTLATAIMLHIVALRKQKTSIYGEYATVLGWPVSYRKLAHVLLFTMAVLFMFFNGLRTLTLVILLNACIIVPHALIRKPTYFDDEDLEKCRPKLGQYAICLIILALTYLEGEPADDVEAESRRAVERERKRLAKVLAQREGRD